ncbi:RxLR effector protein [Phytophthora megakarya]|uniref:RxLR effector protein n=1 Tax=Phytophthora megakarya TaxID=4795 RepID=A0A225VIX3_9STRA|nr:RxLR effector protein [Phytophthora megakarya]
MNLRSRIECPSCIALLTIMILLVSYATAHLEQTEATISRVGRLPDVDDKVAATPRYLRGDAGQAFNNEDMDNEKRGFVRDKISTVLLKWGLKVSLAINDKPDVVLRKLVSRGIWLTEKNLFLWLRYVQQYRGKWGYFWVDDELVVKTLAGYIPQEKLPALFKAMEKNKNLRDFGEDLQKIALDDLYTARIKKKQSTTLDF